MALEVLLSMLLNLPMLIVAGAIFLAPVAMIVYAVVSVANTAATIAERESSG